MFSCNISRRNFGSYLSENRSHINDAATSFKQLAFITFNDGRFLEQRQFIFASAGELIPKALKEVDKGGQVIC